MDRCRPRGNGRPAPPGPRPPGRAVGPHGSRGVLRVHPGTTRGAVEGRWGPGRPLAQERVLCVVTRRGPGRPALVLRPGAPSEVAHLHEGVPRCGRALWGEADRLVGSASRGRSSYAARTCHGPLHRPRLTVAARSLGHLSSSDLRRPDRYFLGRPGGCGATGIQHVGFMGQAPHYLQDSENPAAIQSLVSYTARLLHLSPDMSHFAEAIQDFRTQCDKAVARDRATREHVRKLEQEYDAEVGEERPPLPGGELDSEKLMQELEEFLRKQREGGTEGR